VTIKPVFSPSSFNPLAEEDAAFFLALDFFRELLGDFLFAAFDGDAFKFPELCPLEED
jgi:hypothetical protein